MKRFAAVLLTATAAAVLMAQTDQMPKRKPGLWEMTTTSDASKADPSVIKMCIDAASDAELHDRELGQSKTACSKADIHSDGKSITTDADCAFDNARTGKIQTTTHARTVFTGDTAYHSDISTHYDPPFVGRSEITTQQDGKWTGPCPADMQPGDMIMPGGIKMNMKTMMSQ